MESTTDCDMRHFELFGVATKRKRKNNSSRISRPVSTPMPE
jgi:hypothetical protein